MQTFNNGECQFSLFLLLLLALCLLFSPAVSDDCPDSPALLAFKSSIDSQGAAGSVSDQHFPLSSWTDSSCPCLGSWFGVTCDPSTRRVTRLVLENLGLAGDLRPLGRLDELRVISLKLNRFSSLPVDLSSWPNLKQLHLSNNELSGDFPAGIHYLRRLRRINLSHNNFSGRIPLEELARLPHLLTLRLEENSFSGALDDGARLSTSITDFNVSGNRLVGEIPTRLSHFPATAYAGNTDLCGEPLAHKCTDHKETHKPEEKPWAVSAAPKHHSGDLKKLLAFVAIDVAVAIGAILAIAWCCFKNRKNRSSWVQKNGHGASQGIYRSGGSIIANSLDCKGEMVEFEGCKGFDHVEDLLKASAELLGKGSTGTTYKVATERGDGIGGEAVLVVKRVRSDRFPGARRKREFDGWLKVIGELRHPNVVSLRACYHTMEELLLVYDYLPSGSLYSLLHENRGPGRTPVKWSTRMKIASDSARGLAFLHQHSKAKLFHGHLTTSNILINHSGSALISDAGLAQLFPAPSTKDPYQAPELNPKATTTGSHFFFKYTQYCDVYSFGVVLLEILTGKTATGEGETRLVNWVRRAYDRHGSGKEVFDFEVFLSEERASVEAEMGAVLQVALLCLAPVPRNRPEMGAVHRMIEDIRAKGRSEDVASYATDGPSAKSSSTGSESAT